MGMKYSEIRPLRGTTQEWATYDIVVGKDEMAFEEMPDGTRKLKIGDGLSKWSQLPYAIDFQAIKEKTEIVTTILGEVTTKKEEIDAISLNLINQINTIKDETAAIKQDVTNSKQEIITIENNLISLEDRINLTKTDIDGIKTDTLNIRNDTNTLKLSTEDNLNKILETKTDIELLKTEIDEAVNKSMERPSVFEIGFESDMLKVGFRKGDTVIRTDLDRTYILSDVDPTVLDNWLEIKTPGSGGINTRIICFVINDYIKFTTTSPVIQYPAEGNIVKAIAFCEKSPSGDPTTEADSTMIIVERISQHDFINNTGTWKKIFWYTPITFIPNQKYVELDLSSRMFDPINAFDLIRLTISKANGTMKNLTVQITVES